MATIFTPNGPWLSFLSENRCHFVNLLSFASTYFFLSLRKIMWLNSQGFLLRTQNEAQNQSRDSLSVSYGNRSILNNSKTCSYLFTRLNDNLFFSKFPNFLQNFLWSVLLSIWVPWVYQNGGYLWEFFGVWSITISGSQTFPFLNTNSSVIKRSFLISFGNLQKKTQSHFLELFCSKNWQFDISLIHKV